MCYRFVGNHEDASDLAQDVFIRAYRGLRTFKGQASLGTWLYRIGVNVCLNRVGARGPSIQSLDRLLISGDRLAAPDAESAPDAMLREERAAQVRAAIAKLPRKQRATLILRVYQDLPHAEIAAILGTLGGRRQGEFLSRADESEEAVVMSHLSPSEFIDAADGVLDARRGAHLESCAACRRPGGDDWRRLRPRCGPTACRSLRRFSGSISRRA